MLTGVAILIADNQFNQTLEIFKFEGIDLLTGDVCEFLLIIFTEET